jgi:hypothetical protein
MARGKPSKVVGIGASAGVSGSTVGTQPQVPVPSVPGTGLTGSAVAPVHGKRFIKYYLVTQSEYDTLSHFNTASSMCFGLRAFVIAWPLERLIDWVNAGFLKTAAPEPSYWVLTIIALGAFGLGLYFASKQGSTYKVISAETKHDEVTY